MKPAQAGRSWQRQGQGPRSPQDEGLRPWNRQAWNTTAMESAAASSCDRQERSATKIGQRFKRRPEGLVQTYCSAQGQLAKGPANASGVSQRIASGKSWPSAGPR